MARLVPVHVHPRVAHRPIEQDDAAAAGSELGDLEGKPVPAHAHEWKPSRAAGVFHGLFLPVLLDGHELLVVLAAERTVDGPIVGNAHALPFFVVIFRVSEYGAVFP